MLSANLWHDWPRHQRWPERLEAFAQLAEAVDADILLLQEVARTPTLKADLWLAERLGLAMASARANGDVEAIGFEEGPAILSRFPLGDVHLRQLSHGHNPLARRVALAAHVETPFGRLLVVSVHLGLVQRHNAGADPPVAFVGRPTCPRATRPSSAATSTLPSTDPRSRDGRGVDRHVPPTRTLMPTQSPTRA